MQMPKDWKPLHKTAMQLSTELNCYRFDFVWNSECDLIMNVQNLIQFKDWRMLFLTCHPHSRDKASAGCKLPFSPCCRSELVWSRVQSRPAGRRSRPRCTAGLQTGPLEDRDPSIYSKTQPSALKHFSLKKLIHFLHHQKHMSPTRPWSCLCAPRYQCPCGSCSWRWAAGQTCWLACQETLSQPKTCGHPADAWTCLPNAPHWPPAPAYPSSHTSGENENKQFIRQKSGSGWLNDAILAIKKIWASLHEYLMK